MFLSYTVVATTGSFMQTDDLVNGASGKSSITTIMINDIPHYLLLKVIWKSNGISWNRSCYCILTSSNGNMFRVTDRPLTKATDAELWYFLWLNKQFCKQSKRRWFETPSHSLWRHCNGNPHTEDFDVMQMIFMNTIGRQWTKMTDKRMKL